jgi:hypothetical protein
MVAVNAICLVKPPLYTNTYTLFTKEEFYKEALDFIRPQVYTKRDNQKDKLPVDTTHLLKPQMYTNK